MAPQVGLEPTTLRLTAGCSAIELLRSVDALPTALPSCRCIVAAGSNCVKARRRSPNDHVPIRCDLILVARLAVDYAYCSQIGLRVGADRAGCSRIDTFGFMASNRLLYFQPRSSATELTTVLRIVFQFYNFMVHQTRVMRSPEPRLHMLTPGSCCQLGFLTTSAYNPQ